MSEKIVVCLTESQGRTTSANAVDFLSHARSLLSRATTFGASLCAWSICNCAFSFQLDDLEEAIGFVTGPEGKALAGRFAVGIAQGSLETLAGKGEFELGWGPALQRAMSLAAAATVGEVIIDSDILSVQHVQLVTRGTRTTKDTPPVKGYVIAVDDPFRTHAERTVERLVAPPLVGRAADVAALTIPPGTLATVRAASGVGGTRLLESLGARAADNTVLFIQPVGHGMEPLGCLSRAMARDVANDKAPKIDGEYAVVLRNVIEGRGAELGMAAELLEVWLAGSDRLGNGLLLLDDANNIDSVTLDVVATALLGAEQAFRAVARLDEESPLPAELAPLPPGPEVELQELSARDAAALAASWTGSMRKDAVDVWTRRGGGFPLAIGEAIAEGLSSGELTWTPSGAQPRSIVPAPKKPLPASVWIARRLRFLGPAARSTLAALGVLGGDAPRNVLAKLLDAAADVPTDLDTEQETLIRGGWVVETEPGWLALPSRTHLHVIQEAIPENRRASWNRAASLARESVASPLGVAEAAWHAAAANDLARAHRLATLAAKHAGDAGLHSAARALLSFATSHDPTPRPRIESDISGLIPRLPFASSPGIPEDTFPSALAARGPKRPSRFTFPPVELSDGDLASEPPPSPRVPMASSADLLGPEDIRNSIADDAPQSVVEPMRIAHVTGHNAAPRPPQPADRAAPIPVPPPIPDLTPSSKPVPPALFGPPIPGGAPPPLPRPKSAASKPRPPNPPRVASGIGDREPSEPISLTKPLSKKPRPIDIEIDIDDPPTVRRPAPRERMASIRDLTLDDTVEAPSDKVAPPQKSATISGPRPLVDVPAPPPEIMAISERSPSVDALPPIREQALSDPFPLLRTTRPPPTSAPVGVPELTVIPDDEEPAPASVSGPEQALDELPPIGDVLPAVAKRTPSLADLPMISDEPPTMRVVDELAARLPMLGRAALLSDDNDAFVAWEREVAETGNRSRLIERVRAMAALRRDDPAEAVRSLRVACEQARGLGPVERCRSHLAYAVGLARTGRALESLVEALEALARAREAADSGGEKACVLFLFKLCEQSGHERAAKSWATIGGQTAS